MALLAACAGPSSEKKAAEEDSASAVTEIEHTTNISAYIEGIDDYAGTGGRMLTAHDFAVADNSSGLVAIYSSTGKPLRLYLYPESQQSGNATESWIYLDTLNGKPIMFREVVKEANQVRENSFYYKGDALAHSESRVAADLAALNDAEFGPYKSPYPENDYRMKPAEVNTLATQVMAAVRSQRKDLSKVANEMRLLGASHWATGNEPGWSLAIIPHEKIIFTGNYGADKFELPYADVQKGNKDAAEFSTSGNGHTLSARFEPQRCTDDAGKKHEMTVTVTVDGKVLKGCGDMLY
ncbi:hypothetical protein DLD77_09975 [Chitinophaga alhagiae]|uniref:Lipoprotein n=2 Tax=Chitinophaga alhagiae TaxID=2203219 RepID=A0ABN5LS43_9BACT|nr:hypothetical protein DLD77_09975 [Chitinophaga alhagiae]